MHARRMQSCLRALPTPLFLRSCFTGGFGSFFVAGYECENERALKRLLGGYTGKRM